MKKITTLLIFSLLLSGCAFVDETIVTKKEAITPKEFIEKSMTEEKTYTGELGEDEITQEDIALPSMETLTGSKQNEMGMGIKKSSTGGTATNTSDLTISGGNEQDSLLKSTSDKDVENLINSLFNSTEL